MNVDTTQNLAGNCHHPDEFLVFVRYEAETVRTPKRLVRVYDCYTCQKRVGDDTTDGSLVVCDDIFESDYKRIPRKINGTQSKEESVAVGEGC